MCLNIYFHPKTDSQRQAVKNPGPASGLQGIQPGFLLIELTARREGGAGFDLTTEERFGLVDILWNSGMMEKWNNGRQKRILV